MQNVLSASWINSVKDILSFVLKLRPCDSVVMFRSSIKTFHEPENHLEVRNLLLYHIWFFCLIINQTILGSI